MDQKKIGSFLKNLRKGKGLTQEQLAEQFNVSARTISRWETGSNMPDLSLLVELADFYDVDIRELIEGEKKNKNIDNEIEEYAKPLTENGKCFSCGEDVVIHISKYNGHKRFYCKKCGCSVM